MTPALDRYGECKIRIELALRRSPLRGGLALRDRCIAALDVACPGRRHAGRRDSPASRSAPARARPEQPFQSPTSPEPEHASQFHFRISCGVGFARLNCNEAELSRATRNAHQSSLLPAFRSASYRAAPNLCNEIYVTNFGMPEPSSHTRNAVESATAGPEESSWRMQCKSR